MKSSTKKDNAAITGMETDSLGVQFDVEVFHKKECYIVRASQAHDTGDIVVNSVRRVHKDGGPGLRQTSGAPREAVAELARKAIETHIAKGGKFIRRRNAKVLPYDPVDEDPSDYHSFMDHGDD